MEKWDAYDQNGNRIDGITLIRGEPVPAGMRHLVCDVLVQHEDGDYLLMRRDPRKTYGGMWEATAGGSALAGETSRDCAARELYEETGIRAGELRELGRVVGDHAIYVEYYCRTACRKDGVVLQEGETCDYRWVGRDEFVRMSRKELLTERMQRFINELRRGQDEAEADGRTDMLKLIKRCPEYVPGYRDYCREMYERGVVTFRPTDPDRIDEGWFERTKPWYDGKEKGLIAGQPVSFHYWAVDGGLFIGEFQLRTEFPEKVMNDIGSIGYAVRPSQWGRGFGTEILRQGLELARAHGMEKVLLTISDTNAASIRVCEKLGGVLADTVEAVNAAEGRHRMRRYWITL